MSFFSQMQEKKSLGFYLGWKFPEDYKMLSMWKPVKDTALETASSQCHSGHSKTQSLCGAGAQW